MRWHAVMRVMVARVLPAAEAGYLTEHALATPYPETLMYTSADGIAIITRQTEAGRFDLEMQ